MPYVLVILRGGGRADDDELYAPAHEAFITSLIRRNLVLLGGGFATVDDDTQAAAYLLRCGSVEEARSIAAEDPFVVNDVMRPHCVEWLLIGINPDAIDASAIIRPEDA